MLCEIEIGKGSYSLLTFHTLECWVVVDGCDVGFTFLDSLVDVSVLTFFVLVMAGWSSRLSD